MQASFDNPMLDRVWSESKLEQLPPRNHAVLLFRQTPGCSLSS
jgi:hypothetical protein